MHATITVKPLNNIQKSGCLFSVWSPLLMMTLSWMFNFPSFCGHSGRLMFLWILWPQNEGQLNIHGMASSIMVTTLRRTPMWMITLCILVYWDTHVGPPLLHSYMVYHRRILMCLGSLALCCVVVPPSIILWFKAHIINDIVISKIYSSPVMPTRKKIPTILCSQLAYLVS